MNERRICLVTGANSGIGKSVAAQLAKNDIKVIIACRNVERGQKALQEIQNLTGSSDIELMIVDLSSMKSVRDFCNNFLEKYQRLDILIHNGANFDHHLKETTFTDEGFETILATNYLGPFLMTRLLMPCLEASQNPRMITVGTKGLQFYPFTDLNDLNLVKSKFSTAKAYYNSKLALMMFTMVFSKRYHGKINANGIRVANVALGNERIEGLPWYLYYPYLIKRKFSITTDEMAKTYTMLALSENLQEVTGHYWNENQQIVNFPKQVYSIDAREALWSATEKMLGITF